MLLFNRFKVALLHAFNEQIRTRALLVAEKTSIRPRIVPLPQGAESFTLVFRTQLLTDTLFRPTNIPFVYPAGKDSIATGNGYRSIRIQHELESGAILDVIYALPSASTDQQIQRISLLIWLALPVGTLLAFTIAYWLSSRLLKPVGQVVTQANAINLNTNPGLLPEPIVNDELKELIVSFNRMLIRIREQADRQAAFFASASHELRTPLSVMQTRLQVLLQTETENSAVKELYTAQLSEVRKMNRMVNDFLLLSELRSGDTSLLLTTINIPDLVLDAFASFKERASRKGITFKIDFQPADASYEIHGDEEKMNIIIANLLDNAIKYAPDKTTIDCRIIKNAAAIHIELINVIRPDINPQLADLKNQFYHSKPLHGEGFGLGLWIANQLLIMQGFELYLSLTDHPKFGADIVMPAAGLATA